MSHITTMAVKVTDIEAARLAAQEFGAVLERKSTYNWYSRSVGDYPLPAGMTVDQLGKCDYVIRIPGVRYEVGLVKQGDGYIFAWDFYGYDGNSEHDGHKLLRAFGTEGQPERGVHKLAQAYSVHAVTRAAKKQGYMVARKQGQNGATRLVVTGIR